MDENQINNEFRKTNEKHPNVVRKFYDVASQYINFKVGVPAGLLVGTVNAWINSGEGIIDAAVAFGNQFTYNVLFGGANLKLCEYISTKIPNRYLAIATASAVTTTLGFVATYTIHYYGIVEGTEKPFISSIWQVPLNIGATIGFGAGFRLNDEIEKGLIVSEKVKKISKYFGKLR